MNAFVSGLEKFGKAALKVITLGAVTAKEAAPIVSIFNPAIGALLTGSSSAILAAETAGAAAVAAAPNADVGAQKAALAISAITPIAEKFCSDAGLAKPSTTQIQQFNDLLVAALNVFGAVEEAAKPATVQAVTT